MAERFEGEIDDLYQKWISSPSAVVGARLADRLRVTGRLDEAAEVAGQGLDEWPSNLSLQVVLGRCHLDSGNLEEAREAFVEVRSKDPLNLVALRSLAEIAMRQERWDDAVEVIEEYLFENPTDEEAEQLLEKAKLARKEQPAEPVEEETDSEPTPTGEPTSEVETPVAVEEGEAPEEFPETRRMEKILAGQTGEGVEAPAEKGEDPGGSDPDPDPGAAETQSMRREPRSLLDLFSSNECEDLDLRPFEEGG